MFDLHSHVLPMVDDGVSSINEAAAVFAGMAQLGYSDVVATPHWAVGMPEVPSATIEATASVAASHGITVTVGRECRIHPNLLDHIERTPQLRVNGGNVVLVELPWGPVPDFAESVFGWVMRAGYRPILVHPERHAPLWSRNSPLQRLIDAGVHVQVNLGSLAGEHGNGALNRAVSLLEDGAVTLVATDVHSTADIDNAIPYALTLLDKLVGTEQAAILTTTNPRALLDNQPVVDFRSGQYQVAVDRSVLKNGGSLSAIWGKSIQNLRMRARRSG